jgi:hypothetical protein
MPAPTAPTYSAAAIEAANTALLDLIDAATDPAMVRIRSASDALLCEIELDDPAGTVNGTTGILTLATATADTNAIGTGTAAYGEICDGDGTVILALPCTQGTAEASGFLVLNTLTLVTGSPVTLLSITIG